jgi:hypothetical protein
MGSRISPLLQYPITPFLSLLHQSSTPIGYGAKTWLILNMSRVQNVMTSLWPVRNFFVCRKRTVIVRTAAMNFRSALPPVKQTRRRIQAPVEEHHLASDLNNVEKET